MTIVFVITNNESGVSRWWLLTKKCVKLKCSELQISFWHCDLSLDRFYFTHLPYIDLKLLQESSQFLLDTLSWMNKTDGKSHTQRSYVSSELLTRNQNINSIKIKFVTDEQFLKNSKKMWLKQWYKKILTMNLPYQR